jgi:hypothetical protein
MIPNQKWSYALIAMRHSVISFLLFAGWGTAVFASPAARELFIPGIGSSTGIGGRRYETALWVVNPGEKPANVRIAFLSDEQANASPREIASVLNGGETLVLDPVDLHRFANLQGSGAVRLIASRPITAVARVWSRLPTEGSSRGLSSTIDAIPAMSAIRNGDTAVLPGITVDPSYRYKLYVVETTGDGLDFVLSLANAAGEVFAEQHMYVAGLEPHKIDLQPMIASASSRDAIVRIRGFHGNGRIVATLDQIAVDGLDSDSYPMVTTSVPQPRFTYAEIVAYVAISLMLIAAMAQRRPAT